MDLSILMFFLTLIQAASFAVVDSTVSLLILLSKTTMIEPKLTIDKRNVMSDMVLMVGRYKVKPFGSSRLKEPNRFCDI